MKLKRLFYIILAIVLIRVIFMMFDGYSFNEESCIQKIELYSEDTIEIILRKETEFGSAVLYKNVNSHQVGIAKLQKKFNFIWKVRSNTELKPLDEKVPFVVVGEFIRNSEEEDQFIVGFHSNESDMAFLVCGPEDKNIEEKLKQSNLDFKTFISENPQYFIEEIKGGYSIFLQNEYKVSNWNFYVFDKYGYLIATKLSGSGEAIYTN